ncbi:MAG: ComEC/Rec2 family competence protein [Planctomycetota bacterium]
MEPVPRSPASAPALVAGGVLILGSAAGTLLASCRTTLSLSWGTAVFVAALGALAVRAGAGEALRTKPGPLGPLLLALAFVACGRSLHAAWGDGVAGDVTWSDAGLTVAGRATRDVRAGVRRGYATWTLRDVAVGGDPSARRGPADLRVRVVDGALSPGDRVVLLPSTERRQRARGPAHPASTRPLPLQPLADEIVRLAPSSGRGTESWLDPVRRARTRGIRALAGIQDNLTSGMLAALLFGDLNGLPPGVADLFTRTGTRHMLALSGLHVGLVGWLFALPLSRLIASAASALCVVLCGRRWRFSPAIPAALLALLFVPLAGDGAPAARASLALALAALAPRISRRTYAPNLLGVALSVEVLLDPLAPLRASVQLSYLATAALIWAAGPVTRRFAALFARDGKVARVWPSGRARSPWLRVGAQRALDAAAMAIGASCVASLATLPVAWATFGEFSPVGVIATPLVFPGLVVLVAGGWTWLGLSGATEGWAPALTSIAAGTEQLLKLAVTWMVELLTLADLAPWSPLALPSRPALWLGVCSLAVIAGLRGSWTGSAERALASLRAGALGYALALIPTPGVRPSSLRAFVLDVGSGSATVVQAPGEPTWIMDAGSRDRAGVAQSAVAPLLRHLDVGRVNVWLSHADADHAGALPWLSQRWPVSVWLGPDPPAGRAFRPVELARRARQTIRPSAGRHLVTAAGRALRIASIQSGDRQGNESSSMLDVRWRLRPEELEHRLLLTGDAEGHGLATMLDGGTLGEQWLPKGPVDALLLPHHGSPSRHLGWLLDRLLPVEAWVSGSSPPPDAAEITRRGIRLRSTASHGPLTWTCEPTKKNGSRGTL